MKFRSDGFFRVWDASVLCKRVHKISFFSNDGIEALHPLGSCVWFGYNFFLLLNHIILFLVLLLRLRISLDSSLTSGRKVFSSWWCRWCKSCFVENLSSIYAASDSCTACLYTSAVDVHLVCIPCYVFASFCFLFCFCLNIILHDTAFTRNKTFPDTLS